MWAIFFYIQRKLPVGFLQKSDLKKRKKKTKSQKNGVLLLVQLQAKNRTLLKVFSCQFRDYFLEQLEHMRNITSVHLSLQAFIFITFVRNSELNAES